jgi:hypothetical protein
VLYDDGDHELGKTQSGLKKLMEMTVTVGMPVKGRYQQGLDYFPAKVLVTQSISLSLSATTRCGIQNAFPLR